jgi:hypothetical protein
VLSVLRVGGALGLSGRRVSSVLNVLGEWAGMLRGRNVLSLRVRWVSGLSERGVLSVLRVLEWRSLERVGSAG